MNKAQLLKKYKTELKPKLKVYNKKIKNYERIQTILKGVFIGGIVSIILVLILPYNSNKVDEYLLFGFVWFSFLSLFSYFIHMGHYYPTSKIIDQLERKIHALQSEIKYENQKEKGRIYRREQLKIKAQRRESALDYDSAIQIWEELGEIKEAARIRTLKTEQGSVKVSQKVVHGDEVTKTEIKDSVLNRSNVGSGGNDKLTKIKELKELHDAGAIDDDEFKQMKKEILGK